MPNPLEHRTMDVWRNCDRCGFPFPIGQLTKQQGLFLDQKCIDDLSNYRRDHIIAGVLSEPGEGVSQVEQTLSAEFGESIEDF